VASSPTTSGPLSPAAAARAPSTASASPVRPSTDRQTARATNVGRAVTELAPILWTIGYERLLPPQLTAELVQSHVQHVIDVRFRPQSRRPGMSKTRLGELLRDHGITYEHRRELGTPPHIRPLFHHNHVAEARVAYAEHLAADAPEAIDALADELRNPNTPHTALLCLEADPAVCHRRVITEALRERLGNLIGIDL